MNLTDGESETDEEPPKLFSRQEHEGRYGKIAQLKTEIQDDDVEPYLEQFFDAVTDDVLQIGSISLEEVQVRYASHQPEKKNKYTSKICHFFICIMMVYF